MVTGPLTPMIRFAPPAWSCGKPGFHPFPCHGHLCMRGTAARPPWRPRAVPMHPVLSALDEQSISDRCPHRRMPRSRASAYRRRGPRRRRHGPVSPTVEGESPALVVASREHQCRRRVLHGMDVKQEIDGIYQRADFPCASELHAVAGAVEHLGGPETVEILIDVARCGGIDRIEPRVGGCVHEGEGELAAGRVDLFVHQITEGVRAAELVAMNQRAQHHMRAGGTAVERRHVVDSDISLAVRVICRARSARPRYELVVPWIGRVEPMRGRPFGKSCWRACRRRTISADSDRLRSGGQSASTIRSDAIPDSCRR